MCVCGGIIELSLLGVVLSPLAVTFPKALATVTRVGSSRTSVTIPTRHTKINFKP